MTALRVICATRNRGNRGTEKMTDIYLRALAAAGHEVVLMLPHDALLVNQLAREEGGKQLFLLPDAWRWRAALDPLFRRRMRKILHDADVVIVHNALLESDLRRLCDCPIVAVNHLDKIKRMGRCDAVIALNSGIQKELVAAAFSDCPERVLLLPNGLWEFPAAVSVPVPLIKDSVPVIGFLGALEDFKGCYDLLAAVELIQTPRLRVIFAGSGGAESELKRRAAGIPHRVEFWGHVDDINKFFNSCDIFCLPSYAESSGLSLIEAMAYGLAVVATAAKGPLDIIKDGDNGLLVPPRAPAELAAQLQTLLDDDAKRRRLGMRARETAVNRFSPDIFTAGLSEAAHQIVRLRRRQA